MQKTKSNINKNQKNCEVVASRPREFLLLIVKERKVSSSLEEKWKELKFRGKRPAIQIAKGKWRPKGSSRRLLVIQQDFYLDFFQMFLDFFLIFGISWWNCLYFFVKFVVFLCKIQISKWKWRPGRSPGGYLSFNKTFVWISARYFWISSWFFLDF